MPTPPTPAPSRFQVPGWAVLLFACAAVAAGMFVPGLLKPEGDVASSEEVQPDITQRLTHLYGAAAAILALGLAALLAGRRWLTGASPPGGRQLAVLGGTHVGSRARVVLVRAMGRRLLAGIDAGGIRMLVPVPDGLPSAGPTPPAPLASDR